MLDSWWEGGDITIISPSRIFDQIIQKRFQNISPIEGFDHAIKSNKRRHALKNEWKVALQNKNPSESASSSQIDRRWHRSTPIVSPWIGGDYARWLIRRGADPSRNSSGPIGQPNSSVFLHSASLSGALSHSVAGTKIIERFFSSIVVDLLS